MTNARGVVCYPALCLLFALGLIGCAEFRPVALNPARDAELKTFTVPADKAGLFVYRTAPFTHGFISVIDVDGQEVGRTAYLSYVYVELPPGPHTLRTSGNTAHVLPFEAGAGTITYACEVPSVSLYGVTRLRLVEEAEGREGVRASMLSGEPFVLKPSLSQPLMQTLQVRIEVDSAESVEPVNCEATNDLGQWTFSAPGPVTVQVSPAPLQLACKPLQGFVQIQTPLEPREATRRDNSTQGVKSGAIVGTTVGVGLAVASFPIFGPLGALFVVGGATRGAEIGGLVGALLPARARAYPDPIVVRLTRTAGEAEGDRR